MADDDLTELATRTYLYGYPLVYDLAETRKVFDGSTPLVSSTGPNRFAPARELLGPEAKFVSPNNDTLYLIAACDVSAEPLVLHVPDAGDRYYVLQFVDAWSNNFAYVGRRATGTAEGHYLLTAPGYRGPVPDGATVIEAPSTVFTVVGRIQVNGDADLPAVHALQDAFSLQPLGAVIDGPAPGPALGLPVADPAARADLAWWEQLRVSLAAFPPPPADTEFVAAAGKLGLTESTSPYVDPDPVLAAALVEGRRQADELMETLSRTTIKIVDGWASAMHAFDYNLDRLGLGTIDTPDWKIADRTTAYVTRGSRPAWASGATTATRRSTTSSGRTSTETSSTAPAPTSSRSRRHHPSTRSGRSPCTTSPTTTSWPTPSTASRSATARPACRSGPTAR